jgi:hypothetical protein
MDDKACWLHRIAALLDVATCDTGDEFPARRHFRLSVTAVAALLNLHTFP